MTGERFLDERLERYPACTHGGNGRERYADVEAVRVLGAPHGGVQARLLEAQSRYGRPMAVTEVHLNCTREEQLRWLQGAWQGAREAQAQGADVRAVTAWAAFGAFEWNSLLTRREGHYESGLWDVRAPQPRPTALARLARALARGEAPPLSGLHSAPGWWARAGRLLYPALGEVHSAALPGDRPPLLIVGTGERLGALLRELCAERGLSTLTLDPQLWARLSPADRLGLLQAAGPWGVVSLPGTRLGRGAAHLAQACAALRLPLLCCSGAEVFGHAGPHAWSEADPVAPVDPAARGLAQTERWVLARCPQALVVRGGPLFGTGAPMTARRPCWAPWARGARPGGRETLVSPVYARDFLHEALNLLQDGETGLWHLTHGAPISQAEWHGQLAELLGERLPARQPGAEPLPPPALRSGRGWPMPPLSRALAHWWASTGPELTQPCPPAPPAHWRPAPPL
ncbi:sugar nucleotide-binding protein [Deinococcus multiflagellatus]|uniref:Sugar nucleotide-binding protein n=1 Tax=Deinococcus multiflagellatus TaxID=1656887 RepID=A0ABW1ZSE2_9DEIO